MPDPDFEPNDHAGRGAEQSAARQGAVTRSDLRRWAQRDAQSFLAAHPLPDRPAPELDLAPYLDALAAADTPAEVHAVTSHLLEAAEPVLRAVSDYLQAAAQWRDRHRDAATGSPPRLLMDAASHAWSALAVGRHASLASLRAAYDPAPAPKARADPTSTASALPPAPPHTPPTGPAPGR